MASKHYSRRTLMSHAAGAATLIGLTAGACERPGDSNDVGAGRNVKLPSYREYPGVKPDLPSDPRGVMPGFLTYPKSVKFSGAGPALTGKVTGLCGIDGGGTPPSLDRNSFWQQLNGRLGAELQLTMVPSADYVAKLQTSVAGDDLPDIVGLRSIPRLPDLLAARFTDLGEYLAGDAANDYPALANIPTRSWRSCVYNGSVFAVPLNRSALFREMIVRSDILDSLGLSVSEVTDGESFMDLCREVTIPNKNQWAFGSVTLNLEFVKEMFGAPNVWREENGKFVRDYETEEMKSAIDVLRQMWQSGLFYPDTFGKVNVGELFGAGRIVLSNVGAGTAYREYPTLFRANAPQFDIGFMRPSKWEGGGDAPYYLGPAIYSPVGLKKASPDRIRELLRMMDWLASPFGTEEYLFLNYGTQGVHHTLEGSDPVKTSTGVSELNLPVRYLAAAPSVTYSPGRQQDMKEYHQFQSSAVANGLENAALGLYSPTDQDLSASLYSKIVSVLGDVVQGRQPLSAWDAAVTRWKADGGDKMRAEYEHAFAMENG